MGDIKDVWGSLKRHPALLIGFLFLIVAVLYIVYKSSNANQSAGGGSGSGFTTAQNTPGGTASQLGGYIMYNEEVLNPPAVNISLGGIGRTPHIKPSPHSPKSPKSHPSPKMPASPAHKPKVVATGVTLHQPPVHNSRIVRRGLR